MFACIYFVEDNSLSVVGQKSKRLQHLGQFKERGIVKITWGKDLYLGFEDYLTDFATKANAQILKKLKEKPSEVPEELFTFNHVAKTDGKRQHRETKKIKESRQQEKDFSPKKKSKTMQPKGNTKEKQTGVDSTNPTIVNRERKKVMEKLNLSTCNMLVSNLANQFEDEPSSKLIHDQCAESTVRQDNPLTKSPVQQNDVCFLPVLEPVPTVVKPVVPLSVRACASTERDNEPPIYTPLTATWSLCTNTYDTPDDNSANLLNHPAPPPAILDLFEALCQPQVQIYIQLFVDHYRNQRHNASSFFPNETDYSENGTEWTTHASLQSVQESENGFQQPLQSIQRDCTPNPVNRQDHEPHSFPHSPCLKFQVDVSAVEQEGDDDTVKLLASSDIVVRRSELRKATSAAAKAAPKKAAFTLASKLLPRLDTHKKAGDIRPPLHHARIEVPKDYVIAWCTKNGKDVKEQDINDAITEQVSYARKKIKSQ
ncbi:hypothetical protein ACJMK2_027459 [Sinanodonta woodiana]|uniref:Uncharacterized protein n=1 Tax=Sinanodonta woodiana TaxID=1069815 RepID=A0ABD3XRB2_SINWO